MMRLVLMLIMVNACFIISCSSPDMAGEKLFDISYSPLPSGRMDVFLPDKRNAKCPLVVLIHGGAWVAGDKSWMSDLQDYLLKNGIASANINYRYADEDTHLPHLLADIDNAVSFCDRNAKNWGIENTDIVVCGTSAGGHLALMYGYKYSTNTVAIIAMCPITDLTDTNVQHSLLRNDLLQPAKYMAGITPSRLQVTPEEYSPVSPVYNIKNIPALLIHGTNDLTVPFSQSSRLSDTLRSLNFTHKLLSIPKSGHDLNITGVPATRKYIYDEIVEWIRRFGK